MRATSALTAPNTLARETPPARPKAAATALRVSMTLPVDIDTYLTR